MIYVLLTDGFEEIEALTPVDVLKRCGGKVVTVGVSGKKVIGAHDIPVEADILLGDVSPEDMQMLILPGGPGHTGLKCEKVYDLINYANSKGVCIGSICAAPSILGEIGLLKGRRATCFPGFEQFLEGAQVCEDKVVCDGNFITAKGAGAAGEFSFELAAVLFGKNKADEIKNAMQY